MGAKYSITGDAVNTHATNLDTSVNSLNTQAGAFLTAIEPLPAVWKGSAYGSWDQLTRAWHEAMGELNGALDDIRGRVGNAGALYDRYHAEQTGHLSGVNASANWDATKFRA
jgi:WXG100 family type VII secretion target